MITLIAAHDEKGGIGLNGKLPWNKISADMRFFKETTIGYPILMGRKTFESFPGPLKGRENIVLTRDKTFRHEGVVVAHDLHTTLDDYTSIGLYVIGGAEIYSQCLPYATKVLLTKVAGVYPADTFWNPDLTGWMMVSERMATDKGLDVALFREYIRGRPDIAL